MKATFQRNRSPQLQMYLQFVSHQTWLFAELKSYFFTAFSLFLSFFKSLHYFQLPSIILSHDNFFFSVFLPPSFLTSGIASFFPSFLIFLCLLFLWSPQFFNRHIRLFQLIRCLQKGLSTRVTTLVISEHRQRITRLKQEIVLF